MLLSLKWLRDYVDIPKSISANDLASRLTMHTVEIDSVEDQSEKYKGVVVGKVISAEQHQNADRLRVCKVDLGKETKTIVCGASNVEAGQFVPVATVGTILPGGMEIQNATLRGVESSGMICAEDELGLGDNHAGIMVLEKKAKLGQAFADYLGADDTIIEVDNKSITNRPDLWGHFGIAREIAAFLDLKLKPVKVSNWTRHKDLDKLDVTVEDEKYCQRYMAVALSDLSLIESPEWIQQRLIAAGMRPINNIVDATNYVMLELGQPMHAFASDKIDVIKVRCAKKGEKIETLDHKVRELNEDMLVIADSKNPLAVAGVMGGSGAEINDTTKKVILESANFDAISTRKTSQALGLRTESSMRFEKSLDPQMCDVALKRCVEILRETCPKLKISSELVDIVNFNPEKIIISTRLKWLQDKIGVEISQKQVLKTFTSLGFQIDSKQDKDTGDYIMHITVPSWRATKDISITEDLVEELARIYGYDNIASKMPRIEMTAVEPDIMMRAEKGLKEFLAFEERLCEVYNHSFVGDEQLQKLGVDTSKYLRLLNPVSSQYTLLRQSLIPNLLENIRLNQRQIAELRFFEFGNVYFDIAGDLDATGIEQKLPHQEKKIGIALAADNVNTVLSELKNLLHSFVSRFSHENIGPSFEDIEILPAWAEKTRSAKIVLHDGQNVELGLISLLSPVLLAKLGIKKSVAIAELDLQKIAKIFLGSTSRYVDIGKYPPLTRDLAFVVDLKQKYGMIYHEMKKNEPLISDIELFDIYRDERLGVNKKSMAFHIIYRSMERTLTSEEVDLAQAKLVKRLEERFGAVIRDF